MAFAAACLSVIALPRLHGARWTVPRAAPWDGRHGLAVELHGSLAVTYLNVGSAGADMLSLAPCNVSRAVAELRWQDACCRVGHAQLHTSLGCRRWMSSGRANLG